MKSSLRLRWTGGVIAAIVLLSVPYGRGTSEASAVSTTVNPMPMLMANAPDSFTRKVDAIPRSGWTATGERPVR